jgi:chromate reductase, NAD(P)H dehydrogenase (quinone)
MEVLKLLNTYKPIRILAISGSLRAVSSNTALLRAASILAPDGVAIALYTGLNDLPHFNPDIEGTDLEPSSVLDFRTQLRQSDGVLICSPEYAHGVPGVLKNALDWIVGSGELVGKPVALFNASPRATHAQASLRETISVMDARIIDEASISLPLLGRKLDEVGIASDAEFAEPLRSAIAAFTIAIAPKSFPVSK